MITLVYNVRLYRKLLREIVGEGEIVLEIGPHMGKSTLTYVEKAGKVVLVEKSSQPMYNLEVLREKYPNIHIIKGDARSFDTIKAVLRVINHCDVMAVDIGGGRYPDTVFKVWATWSGVFKPRDSVIRNRGLIEFVERVKIRDEMLDVKFEDTGWLSSYGRAMPYKLKKQLEEFRWWVDVK